MPAPSLGAPTLYDFYLDPSLEAWTTSEDDDDDGFGWQTYFSRRPFRQGVVRASQSPGVKIRGQKLPQKKNKKNKKEKSRAQKKPDLSFEEKYVPLLKTLFTLSDYMSKGFFGSNFSDDDPEEREVTRCCMVSCADECEEASVILTSTAQEVDQITLRFGYQL